MCYTFVEWWCELTFEIRWLENKGVDWAVRMWDVGVVVSVLFCSLLVTFVWRANARYNLWEYHQSAGYYANKSKTRKMKLSHPPVVPSPSWRTWVSVPGRWLARSWCTCRSTSCCEARSSRTVSGSSEPWPPCSPPSLPPGRPQAPAPAQAASWCWPQLSFCPLSLLS